LKQRLLVCLDSDWDAIAQQPDENLLSAATPENLVYLVYRLNRQPQGVAVEHQQLNYLHSILERLDLSVGSSFATVSTFAADPTLLSFQHCVQRMSSRNLARAGN